MQSRQDRIEDRSGEATPVGARDSGCAQADVVLLGVLLGEAKAWRRRLDERPPDTRPSRRRALLALRPLQHAEELVVLDVACGRDHDVSAGVHLSVIGREDALRHRGDHVGGSDHRPTKCVAAEDRFGEEVVHKLLRRVLVHRDLLEHYRALGVEVAEARGEHHVRHDVERGLHLPIGDARVDHRVLPRGCGVQLAAEAVEDLGDLLCRVGVGALEEEMLDEMRGAGLRVGLVPRAGADPEAEGDRADIRDPFRDDSLARVELGEDVFLHVRIIPASRDGRLPR